ncbi:hypothetical protein AXF42_Ash000209 [Apostasia shenzhenica]|uniref:Uncharacterized protein n=1 Tax=Apostasia shenzhenica TaxID=1088818 RepID=A0A2I0AFU7_9ASPA|nr:hypothetical protein AXF42_Ash000209 [Apostasia shenzhenica]
MGEQIHAGMTDCACDMQVFSGSGYKSTDDSERQQVLTAKAKSMKRALIEVDHPGSM